MQTTAYIARMSAIACIGMALAGCETTPIPPGVLAGPPAWSMRAPEASPKLKPGDDLAADNAELRRLRGKDAAKINALQKYIRAVAKT